MKKHWWVLSIGIALFTFLIGILFDKWISNWPLITLKFEADVFSSITSLLSIFITLGVAFWVTMILEKRTSDERTQKDIIIRHTELLFSILEELRVKVREGSIDYLLAASSIKRLNVNTALIVVELVKVSIDDAPDHEQFIRHELAILKDLMTNTLPNDPDLTVVNNVITISASRRVLIESQLDKVRHEFFKFDLTINRA